MDFVLLHRWAYVPARRYWTFGYQTGALSRIFNAVPPRLSSAVEKMMELLQKRYAAAVGEASQKPLTRWGYTGCPAPAPPSPPPAPSEMSAQEDAMWQAEAECGYIRIVLDPATQHRRHVSANARVAAIVGMHHEELLSRFAYHEVPVAFADLDFLRFFVFFLRGLPGGAEPTTCLMRTMVGRGPGARGVLVRYDTRILYDSFGRATEVALSYRQADRQTGRETDRQIDRAGG